MTFASEIVQDGLALALVDSEDIGLDGADFAIGTRFLNDFAAELFDLGVDFGYRPVSSSGDPITSPSSVNRALKENLGIILAPAFGLPVSADARRNADNSLKALKSNFMRRAKRRFPSTLPTGSGNLHSIHSHVGFYPFPLPDAILRQAATNTITIATIDVAVIIDTWTIDRSVNLTSLAAGTVQWLNDDSYLAMLEASFTVNAAGSDQFTLFFRKNSAELEESRIVFDADVAQNINMRWAETLRRNDTIDIAVENNTDTTDFVITDGHFTVK